MDRMWFATSSPGDGVGSRSAHKPSGSSGRRRTRRASQQQPPPPSPCDRSIASSSCGTTSSYDSRRRRRVPGRKHNPRNYPDSPHSSSSSSDTSSTASSSDHNSSCSSGSRSSVDRHTGRGRNMPPQQSKDVDDAQVMRWPSPSSSCGFDSSPQCARRPADDSSLEAFERALESECPSLGPSLASKSAATGGHSSASTAKSGATSGGPTTDSNAGSYDTYGTGCATAGTLQTRASRVRQHLLRKRQQLEERRARDEADRADGEASRARTSASKSACGTEASPAPSRDWRPRERGGGCPGAAEGEEQPVIAFKKKSRAAKAVGRAKLGSEEAPRSQVIRRSDGAATVSTGGSASNASKSWASSIQTATTVSSLGSWSAPSLIARRLMMQREASVVSGGASVHTTVTSTSWVVPTRGAAGCLPLPRRIPIDRRTRLLLVFPVAVLCALSFAVLGSSHIKNAAVDAHSIRYGPQPPPSSRQHKAHATQGDAEAHRDVMQIGTRRRLRGASDSRDGSEGPGAISKTKGGFLSVLFPFLASSSGGDRRRHNRDLITLTPDHVDKYPFTNLADVTNSLAGKNDTAFYWQIPRSGGTTLKHILGSCLDRVQASRVSSDYCDVTKDGLEVCDTKFGRFVNADPSDDPGIRRASELGLVQSGLADVVVSSRFLHAASLFDPQGTAPLEEGQLTGGKGRAFTVFRHPVERAASTFYYLRDATWERNYSPEFKKMSLKEYAEHPDTAHDWMVRWLTGKNHASSVTRDDLEFAKTLLKRKFLIMLTDDMAGSVDRLIKYMGWEDDVPKTGRKCSKAAGLKVAAKNAGDGESVAKVEEGSDDWIALASINELDVELYEYARDLYHEQWRTVFKGKVLDGVGGVGGVASPPPDMAKIAAKFTGEEVAATKAKGVAPPAASVKDRKKEVVAAPPASIKDAKFLEDAAKKKAELPLPPAMAQIAAAFGAPKGDANVSGESSKA